MKTKTKTISAILALVLFSSCVGDAKETTYEGDYELDLLFEKDGCKIYRFYDDDNYVYWSNCEGSIQSDQPNDQTYDQFHKDQVTSFTNKTK